MSRSVTTTSDLPGNPICGGSTPMISEDIPSMTIRWPTIDGSALKCLRQKASLSSTVAAPPGWSSAPGEIPTQRRVHPQHGQIIG